MLIFTKFHDDSLVISKIRSKGHINKGYSTAVTTTLIPRDPSLQQQRQRRPRLADASWFLPIRLGDAETASRRSRENVLSSLDIESASFPDDCSGKEPFVEILVAASYRNLNATRSSLTARKRTLSRLCRNLPHWEEVVDLYGEGPRIIGTDTCSTYRGILERDRVPRPMPRIAGMYNTGSTAAALALHRNLYDQGLRTGHLTPVRRKEAINNFYRVPWGKVSFTSRIHQMADQSNGIRAHHRLTRWPYDMPLAHSSSS